MSYSLSGDAGFDLFGIFMESWERFGEAQANSYRASLVRAFDLLSRHPEAARLREELHPPIRVLPHSPYLIFYDLLDDGDVVIQRIRHGREDWLSDYS